MCNCQNNCGCSEKTVEYNICNPCPAEPCTCPVEITTNCITLAEDLSCSGVLAGTNFTEALQQVDEYICDALSQLGGTTNLVNIGEGAEIYKGVDGLGRREIKSIVSDGGIVIVENPDTISLNVTGAETKITAGTNTTITGLGTTASPYIVNSIGADGSETKINIGSNLSISGNGTTATPYIITNTMVVDGSETKIASGTGTSVTGNGTITTPYQISVDGAETKLTAGTNVTVTGNGSVATPYIINSTGADGSETKINAGTNISVTGTGTTGTPYVINNTLTVDGSETKLNGGTTTTVAGNGTIATPYTVEVKNNQKVLTYPGDFTGTNYTLTNSDFDTLIFVNNGATNVTITVPTGLVDKFYSVFIRQGSGEVSFVASGTTINTAVGLKISLQNDHACLDKVGATTVFHLTGNTKV